MNSSSASVHYIDAICLESNWLYLATQLDTLDPSETAHTRMSILDRTDEVPWRYHDYKDNVVSVAASKGRSLLDGSRYAALGRHGRVHFNFKNAPTFQEQLPGAGMLDANVGGLMTHLREIGGQLWACGQRGQVFRRFARDDWRHEDKSLHEPIDISQFAGDPGALALKMTQGPMLNCVDGNSQQDVYVVGDRGFMAHFDGKVWKRVALPHEEHLQWIRCYGADEVWACGFNGSLLEGNARDGFEQMSGPDDHQTWVCLSKFQGKVYLTTDVGLYAYDGKKIGPVKTNLQPELEDAWRVDHADGELWSIGVKDLARFDGKKWERIHHPDNERLGA